MKKEETPGGKPHGRTGTLKGVGNELDALGIRTPPTLPRPLPPMPAEPAPPPPPPDQEPPAPTSDLSPGMIVAGKFALVKLVAEGGLAQVFEAEDTLVGRRVAIKVLLPEHARDADTVRRFRREAHATALVDHPNVVTIYEVGRRSDGSLYIVQELLQGPTLHAYRQTWGRLSEEEALRIITPISGALATAHAHGVVHRDVKSGNVVLSKTAFSDLVPKLIDFGVARLQSPRDKTKTAVRTLLGTAHYMSPEQALGESWVDGRTDVWAVGVVLYELLTGTYPFDGTNEHAILAKVVEAPVPRIEERAPGIRPALAALVHRALERDADRRPEMRALHEEFSMLSALRGADAAPGPSAVERRRIPEPKAEIIDLPPPGRRLALELGDPDSSADDDAEELGEGDYEEIEDLMSLDTNDAYLLENASPSRTPSGDWIRGTSQVSSEFARPGATANDLLRRFTDASLRALSLNALEDAVSHAETALALQPEPAEAAQLHQVQAIARLWLGSHARAEASAYAALRLMPPGSTGWYAAFGHVALARSRLGELDALPEMIGALSVAPGGRFASGHVIAVARLSIAMIRGGMLHEARQLVRSMRDRMDAGAQGEPVVYAWLDCAFAERAAFVGDPSRELSRRVSALERFTAAGDVRNACQERASLGAVFLALGELEEAERVLGESLRVALPMKLHLAHVVETHLALAALRGGDADRALIVASAALDGLAGTADRRADAFGHIVMSQIQAKRGERESAFEAADHAVAAAERFPDLYAHALATRAALQLAENRTVDALDDASRAVELMSENGGAGSGESLVRLTHAIALRDAGDHAGAERSALTARDRVLALGQRLMSQDHRKSFFERVPENAQILVLSRSFGAS
ncbi:MAG: serine/threonine protein kinase [Polyangiaceae bacterium]|nr:serine/threonine protein kinase [Polyangiaceae bacterium]